MTSLHVIKIIKCQLFSSRKWRWM